MKSNRIVCSSATVFVVRIANIYVNWCLGCCFSLFVDRNAIVFRRDPISNSNLIYNSIMYSQGRNCICLACPFSLYLCFREWANEWWWDSSDKVTCLLLRYLLNKTKKKAHFYTLCRELLAIYSFVSSFLILYLRLAGIYR